MKYNYLCNFYLLKNKYLYIFRILVDLITIALAFILALVIGNYLGYYYKAPSLQPIFLTTLFIWYIASKVFYLYNDITLVSYSQEIVGLIKVTIFHILLLVFLLFIFNLQDKFRIFILYYSILLFPLVAIQKYFYRIYYANSRFKNKNVKNTLIVGNKNISNFLNGTNLSNNNLNLNIIGVINDDDTGKNSYNVLGPIKSIASIITSHSIDQVLVCLPNDDDKNIEYVVSVCENLNILVSILSSPTNQFGMGSKRVTNYANIPILFFKNYPLDDLENKIFKRVFDIIFSLFIILFIFTWLFPIVAILIKLSSRGPVFYIQYRWGINNKKIKCFKFRTMYIGDNEISPDGHYMPATQNDQRISTIGHFLRKTSIDEMPQFFNVILGGMSVVGPRPHPIPLNLESKDHINNYLLRHLIKPGITGWAQVNGSRGEVKEMIDMQNRVNFDIWYIENWTYWLDLQIIFQTIINLIKGDEKAF